MFIKPRKRIVFLIKKLIQQIKQGLHIRHALFLKFGLMSKNKLVLIKYIKERQRRYLNIIFYTPKNMF